MGIIATSVVGIILAFGDLNATWRTLIVSFSIVAILVYFNAPSPVLKFYSIVFLAIIGAFCYIYWYKENY